MCLTSDSEDDGADAELKKDMDEEEIKEMKEMENIEGMLDDDGLQNELAITESEHSDEEGEGEGEGEGDSTSPDKSKNKDKGVNYKKKMPQYVIDGPEQEDEEWIMDHTGIKRKPFKVMHREIKEIIKGKIVIAHNLPKDFAYLRITRHD